MPKKDKVKYDKLPFISIREKKPLKSSYYDTWMRFFDKIYGVLARQDGTALREKKSNV